MADDPWRQIRALRAAPPLLAAQDPERRAVFGAALQQSEELFEASSAVSPAAKPLPLFYALSQAGRAIAAAHNVGDTWKITGHGLSARHAEEVTETVVTVKQAKDRTDAISAVTRGLDSPPLEGSLSLPSLWAALPELATRQHMSEGALRAIQFHPLEIGNPTWEDMFEPPAYGRVYLTVEDEKDVPALLGRYARTDGYAVLESEHSVIGIAKLTLQWARERPPNPELIGGGARIERLSNVASLVDGDWFLVPRLGAAMEPQARLLVWWALLYGLSSLSRYHPSAWVASLDVDRSLLAVDLEVGLRMAETRLPGLLATALGRPGGPARPVMNLLIAQELKLRSEEAWASRSEQEGEAPPE